MPQDPGFKAIAQIAIVCRDIEATAQRWAALLGVEAPKSFTTKPGLDTRMTYRGKPSNAQCKLAFFDTGGCVLELIQPLGPGSSWQDGLDETGEAVHHIAFKVKDLDGSLKACKEIGMPLLHYGRWGGDDGDYAYIDSKRQLGVTVELLHADKDGK
jgi:catechol 2,3-dioxygenase-like lactoylglutathione lyase family enzyme